MFTLSHIRANARQTMEKTPGIYFLPIIPIVISILIQLISSSSVNSSSFTSLDTSVHYGYLLQLILFPTFYGLLMGLITLSISLTIYKIIQKKQTQASITDALTVFNHSQFRSILKTYLLKSLLLFLWGLPFSIGIALFISSFVFLFLVTIIANSNGLSSLPPEYLSMFAILFFSGVTLSILGLALYAPQVYAYSQVDYLLFRRLDQNDYRSASSLIKESRQLMKGYKWKRFLLDISFLGWFILSAITFGIAGIYVIPYYCSAEIEFHMAILKEVGETPH